MPTVRVFPFSIFDPVHLGLDENGEHVTVNLAERNILVGGEPGAGKSSALNLITAHGALSADCKLALIDGKQVELGPWRLSADIFVGPSITDALAAITSLQQTMNDRYDHLLATGRRKITRDDGEPVYLIPIDEYAHFSATVGSKQQRDITRNLWSPRWFTPRGNRIDRFRLDVGRLHRLRRVVAIRLTNNSSIIDGQHFILKYRRTNVTSALQAETSGRQKSRERNIAYRSQCRHCAGVRRRVFLRSHHHFARRKSSS